MQVKNLNFYDVVLDFILMDSFEDLENPPTSIQTVVNNRWLNSSFKKIVSVFFFLSQPCKFNEKWSELERLISFMCMLPVEWLVWTVSSSSAIVIRGVEYMSSGEISLLAFLLVLALTWNSQCSWELKIKTKTKYVKLQTSLDLTTNCL